MKSISKAVLVVMLFCALIIGPFALSNSTATATPSTGSVQTIINCSLIQNRALARCDTDELSLGELKLLPKMQLQVPGPPLRNPEPRVKVDVQVPKVTLPNRDSGLKIDAPLPKVEINLGRTRVGVNAPEPNPAPEPPANPSNPSPPSTPSQPSNPQGSDPNPAPAPPPPATREAAPEAAPNTGQTPRSGTMGASGGTKAATAPKPGNERGGQGPGERNPPATTSQEPSSEDSPSADASPRQDDTTRDRVAPRTDVDERSVLSIPAMDLSLPEAVGMGLMTVSLLALLMLLSLWAGYYLGYKDADKKEAQFLKSLLRK